MNWLKSLGGSIAKSVAGDAFHAIAVAFATAASHVLGWLWGELDSATAVSLQGPAFTRMLDITFTIAIVIGVALYAIQVAVSVLRRDFSGLGRALRGVVVAEMGTFAAIILTNELLAATDSLSAGVMQAGAGVSTFQGLGNLVASGGVMAKLTDAAMLLVALVLIVGCVMVWFALVVRKLLVIIAAVFAPIAFAGAQADISMGWVRKWIEGMVALVFSKLLLVLVLVIGWNVLLDGLGNTGKPSVTQEVTALVTGALILCVGGLAPWAALKMVHFAGEHFHQIHTHAAATQQAGMAVVAAPRRAYSGAMTAAPHVQRPVSESRLLARALPPRCSRRTAAPRTGPVNPDRPRRRARAASVAPPPGRRRPQAVLMAPGRARRPARRRPRQPRRPRTAPRPLPVPQRRPRTGLLPPPNSRSSPRCRNLPVLPLLPRRKSRGALEVTTGSIVPTARFARRPARGVMLGYSGWRLAALGLAGLFILFGLLSGAGGAGIGFGLLMACPLVAAAYVRVAGRHAVEWIPVAGHWQARRLVAADRLPGDGREPASGGDAGPAG